MGTYKQRAIETGMQKCTNAEILGVILKNDSREQSERKKNMQKCTNAKSLGVILKIESAKAEKSRSRHAKMQKCKKFRGYLKK